MMEDVTEDMPPEAVKAADEAFPDLPVVVVSHDELVTADDAIQALAKQPNVYQRAGKLVHVVREPLKTKGVTLSPNAPRIVEMPRPRVRELLSHCVEFRQWKAKRATKANPDPKPELVRIRVPSEIPVAIHARGQWTDVRLLEGVTETPVLRADGSVLDVPGYDQATALIYEPNAKFPEIPKKPTIDDAKKAIALLADVVCDFPFQEPAHRSAWLALALTPFARPAFEGCAPLGLVDKNVRGAGGTLLCELIGTIYTGRPLARMSQADDTETRKRITTIAMTGAPIVLIDNITGTFGGPALEAALTAPVWSDRELGGNKDVTLPLRCLWLSSGNNATPTGDLIRRILNIRLESFLERPEERSGFKHPDLLGYVYANRPALVTAAVTTLRAFFAAGCPDQKLSAWGSFEGWSRLVRGALVWAGEPDPCSGRKELVEMGDRDVELLERLLVGWETFGAAKTVGEAIALIKSAPALHGGLRDVLCDLCRVQADKLTARVVGNRLNKFKRRVVGNRYLDCDKKTDKGVPWVVRQLRPADSTDSNDSVGSNLSGRDEQKEELVISSRAGESQASHQSQDDDDVERFAIQAEEVLQ